MRLNVSAPAKINLFLDITGRRNDGYHLINTVMQTVSLYDDVSVTVDEDEEGISVSCTDGEIPVDESNTAYRAAKEFLEAAGRKKTGVYIKIKKRIPSGAGLAGGSADAAAVIYALNELLETGFDTDELAEIGEKIGADVPFCIYGGTMNATGIGTIFSPLPDMPDCSIVIVKPEFRISTKEAYEKSDETGYEVIRKSDSLVDSICNGSVSGIAENLYNKFEEVVNASEIESIKEKMLDMGALGACMTGSGSAVFALFDDDEKANDCALGMKNDYAAVFNVRPVTHGPKPGSGFGLFSIFDDN